MNPGRYFIPYSPYTIPIKNPGLFTRIFSNVRGINWSSLLTNANKTLNVVNQTIPLIRQTGPMLNNLRSIIQLTRAFNNETITKNVNPKSPSQKSSSPETLPKNETISINSEHPNFFI